MIFGYSGNTCDTACDTSPCEPPTIGAMTLETLDMQSETMAMLCNIVSLMWGEDSPAPQAKPNENLQARLMAIKDNQRAIMNAVKAITERL